MTKGQRRPKPEDMAQLMVEISEGKSLRAVCRDMGMHTPNTHDFINADAELREQYARARELRAEVFAEEALTVTKAAALGKSFDGNKVEANGARVYLDAIKWAAGRMAPKSGPIQRISFEDLSDSELDARLARLELGNDEPQPED